MADLAAPCGLNCKACPLYKAEYDADFRKTLAAKMKVQEDKARCPGCRPAGGQVTPMEEKCRTFACAASKQIDFCYQCGDFPCQKLAPCADRANILPHNMKIFSLLTLQQKGREKWEEEYPRMASNYFRGHLVLGAGPEVKPAKG